MSYPARGPARSVGIDGQANAVGPPTLDATHCLAGTKRRRA